MTSREAENRHEYLRVERDRLEPNTSHDPPHQRVEQALRSAFVAQAPVDLTARLLALATPAPELTRLDRALKQAMVVSVPPELARRLAVLAYPQVLVAPARSRWMWAAYALGAALLGVILVFAAQAMGVALQQLGVPELWSDALRTPEQWLAQFYAIFPQGKLIVEGLVMLQSALQWVLVGLILWMVLELRTPRRQEAVANWN